MTEIKKWQDIVGMGFPKEPPMTKKRIRAIVQNSNGCCGNVRIVTGRIMTDADLKRMRETPLP